MKIYNNYLLVTLVLILEVTVFFDSVELPISRGLSIITLGIITAFFLKRKEKLNLKVLFVLYVLILLIYVQGFFFGFSPITAITYPFFVLLIPYLLYKVVGNDIFKYVVNVIFITALVASSIWLLQVLFTSFDIFVQSLRFATVNPLISGSQDNFRVSIGMLYTINHWTINIYGVEVLRNAGLYHEPGAFAYFLILAIGINTIIQKSYYNKKNIILSIIMVTTFSTAGYLALFVLLTYTVLKSKKSSFFKIINVSLFTIVVVLSFTQIDFLQEKLERQYETQINMDLTEETSAGRVLRIRRALNLLSTSPVIGRGIISAARDFEPGSPYFFTGAGIWRTLSSYGILFTPIILFFYIKGINNTCNQYHFDKNFTFYLFIAIAIGATSQRFFMDNITMLLFIAGLVGFKEHK